MKLFVNQKTRALGIAMLSGVLVFLLFAGVLVCVMPHRAAYAIWAGALVMAFYMMTCCIVYLRGQNRIIEYAKGQIIEYLSGNEHARIECDEEGELYRLFHEVNAMAAILNAHAAHEGEAKEFLRNTISDISHQLKTPLAALNIYNGIIQEEAGQQATVSEFAGLCEEELERIETLVQNLLKIARLDAGTVVFAKQETDTCDLAKRVKRHFAYRLSQEKKELRLSGEAGVMLLCDAVWMTEALDNLVKNALDHTKAGDVILLSWGLHAGRVQITVRDGGCGIHPEDLYHIFKRFYRSRFGTDTKGVGLGLPLVKAIVENHGGWIEVDSQPGQGTTFVLTF
ncbi:HAMP domain-containing sensor histidine kinase [Lachnospiraceae bacterium 47-T17]